MSQVKSALMATATVLAVVFVLNQFPPTKGIVQRALAG
jgi:hypothetical protein